MAKIKATDLDYQEVFQQKLIEANSNLKRDRVRVSIKQTGLRVKNSIQLRYVTFMYCGEVGFDSCCQLVQLRHWLLHLQSCICRHFKELKPIMLPSVSFASAT